MGKPATLKIDILADVANAARGIESIDKKLGGLAKLATGAAIAGGALVAGKALVGLAGDALKAGEAGAALTRTTEQLLTQTGNAANTSADHLVGWSDSMARLTGVGDDQIQAGQNLLLTFTAISNEVDDGTGVFDRATKAALDLAGAGFGSMETNATQLGKALQDPTKGMAALTKSGVSFTAQEQDTIRALQESGRMFEAQNLVLKAVENQVGGAAEASATASSKLQVAWGQTLETLGTALLPIVNKLLPVVTDLLDGLVPVLLPVVDLIADLAGELLDALLPAIEPLIPVIAELGRIIATEMSEIIRELAPLLPRLTTALAGLLLAVLPLLPIMVDLGTTMLPLLPLFTDIIELVANLARVTLPLIIYPLSQLAAFMNGVAGATERVVGWLRTLVGWVNDAVNKLGSLISKIRSVPGVGFLGGVIGRLPWSEPPGSSPSTFGAPAGRSTTTRIQVDVTGVGFDSILTGRAIARQLATWNAANGLSPVQWAERNGGLPA